MPDVSFCEIWLQAVESHIACADYMYTYHFKYLRVTQKQIKTSCKNDYKQYISDAACRAATAEQAGDTATLYRIVRELSPKKPRPLNMCKLEDGSNAATPVQSAERWERFFASKTGGVIQNKDDLFNSYVISCGVKKQQASPTHLQLQCIPSLCTVEKTLKAGKSGKGHDEYAMCAEIFKSSPELFARLLWPLWMKLARRFEHPLASKGGMLCSIFKGSGSIAEWQQPWSHDRRLHVEAG